MVKVIHALLEVDTIWFPATTGWRDLEGAQSTMELNFSMQFLLGSGVLAGGVYQQDKKLSAGEFILLN